MECPIKIATLNLCLGIKNKKEAVRTLIEENKIDILCLQETEITPDFPTKLLTFGGYNYESEKNNIKARCGIYISNNVSYVRRDDIEIENNNLIIIDLNDKKKTRIINIYRPFNPPNVTQKEFFESQLQQIINNTNQNTIIVGDFNLDHSKKYDVTYSHKNYFTTLNEEFDQLQLLQIVNFHTWSRVINSTLCSSIIDHIYTRDTTLITNLCSIAPPFGDHLLITFTIRSLRSSNSSSYKRNWKNYNKSILNENLAHQDWDLEHDEVQACWNSFESKLVKIIDKLAPPELSLQKQNIKINTPPHIKNKMNKRSRLLKKFNANPTTLTRNRNEIKLLNKEIKHFFHNKKGKEIRRGIMPGNSKTLWDAVKKAKDCNIDTIPDSLTLNNVPIAQANHAQAFANFFSNKVNSIVTQSVIDDNVYNGKKLFDCPSSPFMSNDNILECLKDIKIKNCEGFDRIPQRVLADGAELLVTPLSTIFQKIYDQKKIPEQWSVSKVIPLHKKGPKNQIENYRPISNLCSTSKVFEKLILKRLLEINSIYNVDITGKHQHGFKKQKSTSTLTLQLQSLIAKALDEDNYVIMASLDLSAAFDVVNTDLLLERLRVIGLPIDLVALIETWLTNRQFYVQIGDLNSNFIESNTGTIQGSILGPILYAIFVAPLYDISKLSNFADDNFALNQNKIKNTCIIDMEIKLRKIIKWLKNSGLKVNESKTEICMFHRKDTTQVEINVSGIPVKSKDHMNVVGVMFDSKLNWAKHVSIQVNKANSALHAIKLIKKYFKQDEILTLLTSNFYSILYYNSEVWHIPALKPEIKQTLFSASARALKISQHTPNRFESYRDIHLNCKRAHPNQMIIYKHSIILHKLYNTQTPQMDWIHLNFNQTFTSRQTTFKTIKSSNFKVGENLLSTRLSILNGIIPLIDLNLSLNAFKVKYKKILLNIS